MIESTDELACTSPSTANVRAAKLNPMKRLPLSPMKIEVG